METIRVQLLDESANAQYGLNWGQRDNRDPNQAYLQLDAEVYKSDFFPPKGKFFITDTDDGKIIILNRAQKEYGCALQTPENNAILGKYIRDRIGVADGHKIDRDDIIRYGRLFISFYRIDEMHYFLDFSKSWKRIDLKSLYRHYLITTGECGTWKSAEELITKLVNWNRSKGQAISNLFDTDKIDEIKGKISQFCGDSNAAVPGNESCYSFFAFLSSEYFKAHFGPDSVPDQLKTGPNQTGGGVEELQVIYYGAPGTGKSYAIDAKANPERTIRTTFHPDSDYASFVGAYKPTMADAKINSIYGESVQYATGKNGHPGTEKKIVYKYVPQAFLKAYVEAWKDISRPFFLVIEEINRGNCAQIFGDLFQLLDRNNQGCSSYATAADEDIAQFLSTDPKGFAGLSDEARQAIASFTLVKDNGTAINMGRSIINGEKLLLPPNLHIWATMNTSDQSLFPIDSAFKRRWNWQYVPIAYDKEDWTVAVGDNRYGWGDFLRAINPIIARLTESPDKQMGYYFAKPDKSSARSSGRKDVISENILLNKVLFYLWTDVLKDFDIGEEPFINPDTKKAYDFSDFFDSDNDYLLQFVDKLGLAAITADGPSADATTRD